MLHQGSSISVVYPLFISVMNSDWTPWIQTSSFSDSLHPLPFCAHKRSEAACVLVFSRGQQRHMRTCCIAFNRGHDVHVRPNCSRPKSQPNAPLQAVCTCCRLPAISLTF
eukprot:703535-Pelagomonas_calceolata.AAC.2